MMHDVAIVGGGPAGATCAAFCAGVGKSVVILEREKFPREKVCGDCLNPGLWPTLRRLELEEKVLAAPRGKIDRVEFINLRGRRIAVPLPLESETVVKRSVFDSFILERARELGAKTHQRTTLTALERTGDSWKLHANDQEFLARVLVAADGRNSTVARLLNLLPKLKKDRVAWQAHVPLPENFGQKIVLQWLPDGYSGQAPVNEHELNLCLVGRASAMETLKNWATHNFALPATQSWRTITPLARRAIAPAHEKLLFVGDAARVVEPFTGEGIYYALRSGELAAEAIVRNDFDFFAREHRAMYRGRGWINRLSRLAVVSPRLGSFFLECARFQPALLRFLTAKIEGF